MNNEEKTVNLLVLVVFLHFQILSDGRSVLRIDRKYVVFWCYVYDEYIGLNFD